MMQPANYCPNHVEAMQAANESLSSTLGRPKICLCAHNAVGVAYFQGYREMLGACARLDTAQMRDIHMLIAEQESIIWKEKVETSMT